jgi:hypothetical protein
MAKERWLFLRDDGQLMWHEENDGIVFLRKGPEARERPASKMDLRLNPHHWERFVEGELRAIRPQKQRG